MQAYSIHKANIFNVYGQSIFYWQSHSQHCDEDDKRSDYTASATDKIVQLHNRLHSENVTIAFFSEKETLLCGCVLIFF